MYEAQDFSHLLGTEGFSDELLNAHFKLYEGYVKNTSALVELIEKAEAGSQEYIGLSQRFGWEFNGMRLHEYYFGNMTKEESALAADSALAAMMTKSFGSVEAGMEDYVAKGKIRGIGWVVMYYDATADRLYNVWINEHDLGHLAGAAPVLVMDVFEHAYIADYGTDRGSYIDAFLGAINWEAANERMEAAKA